MTDSTISVLIVEDSPDDTYTWRRYLEGQEALPCRVSEAAGGEDGLSRIHQAPPDCLLLDYRLPDLDGIEFLTRLRGHGGHLPCPVVMITGQGDERVATQALQLGAQDYVVKSTINAATLVRSLRNAMDRHAEEAALLREARFDALTTLPNRRLLLDRLGQLLSDERPGAGRFGLLFIDLDEFKPVNDRHGHRAGDRVLAESARRLRRSVRPGDMVARLGGDEFVALLEGVDRKEDVEQVAGRIIENIAAPVELSPQCSVRIGASVGAVLAGPEVFSTGDRALEAADAAMYRAKQAGRGRYCVHTADPEEDSTSTHTRHDLLRAIDQDQLRLFYQPIRDLRQGDLLALEALVRWQHPTRGLLDAGEFVPRFYGLEISHRLDAWVFEHAMDQARSWVTHAGRPVALTLNLSPRQFHSDHLPQVLQRAGRARGFPLERLVLDIDESVLLQDVNWSSWLLGRLTELGVRVCVQGFASGFTSLRYLQDLALDSLKLDLALLRGMPDASKAHQFARLVSSVAEPLGMQALASGLEHDDQVRLLRDLTYAGAQGYRISPPVPAGAVPGELLNGTGSWLSA